MRVWTGELSVQTQGKGTEEITGRVEDLVRQSGVSRGVAHVFVCHTSCSLVLFENADPTARRDLEAFFDRLVPEDTPYFVHTYEGPDDMPSHIRMALTHSGETLPVRDGRLALGVWQGLFLFEHRTAAHRRRVLVTLLGE